VRGLEPLERGRVARRGHDDAPREPLRPERPLDEVAHLSAALADEADDGQLRPRVPGDLPEERGLAHSRGGEDADPLPLADREEPVHRADAEREWGRDSAPLERARRRPVHRPLVEARGQRPTVDGTPEPVEDPPEERVAGADRERATGRNDLAVRAEPGGIAEREQHRPVVAEPHHLGEQRAAAGGVDLDRLALPDARGLRLDDEADEPRHPPAQAQRRGAIERRA
jgi:hypothetical protein